MPKYLQSFPESIYKGLEEGFIVGNGLEYVSICRHVADGPLAQPRTTQAKDVTEEKTKKQLFLMCASKEMINIYNNILLLHLS